LLQASGAGKEAGGDEFRGGEPTEESCDVVLQGAVDRAVHLNLQPVQIIETRYGQQLREFEPHGIDRLAFDKWRRVVDWLELGEL